MSRIGKKSITLPKDVTVQVEKEPVTVKGPKGTLSQPIDPDFTVEIAEGELTVIRPTEQKRHKALHGLVSEPLSPI